MTINRTDVIKVAHLARIEINEENIDDYTRDLTNILGMVDQMQMINTKTIVPMAHPLDAIQRLRTDEVVEPDQREHFQSVAPETEAGLYLVPKVID